MTQKEEIMTRKEELIEEITGKLERIESIEEMEEVQKLTDELNSEK